jgi:hypothetical protein
MGASSDVAHDPAPVCCLRLDSWTRTSRQPGEEQEDRMPRYLIERTFPDGLHIPLTEEGANVCHTVVANNTDDLVTWVHSYVTEDKSKTYCIYDAPSPEAIRRAARRNNLPVDKITEVQVLDPYFYR